MDSAGTRGDRAVADKGHCSICRQLPGTLKIFVQKPALLLPNCGILSEFLGLSKPQLWPHSIIKMRGAGHVMKVPRVWQADDASELAVARCCRDHIA